MQSLPVSMSLQKGWESKQDVTPGILATALSPHIKKDQ